MMNSIEQTDSFQRQSPFLIPWLAVTKANKGEENGKENPEVMCLF